VLANHSKKMSIGKIGQHFSKVMNEYQVATFFIAHGVYSVTTGQQFNGLVGVCALCVLLSVNLFSE